MKPLTLEEAKDQVAKNYQIAGRKASNWDEFWHDCLSYETFQSLHIAMDEAAELYKSSYVTSLDWETKSKINDLTEEAESLRESYSKHVKAASDRITSLEEEIGRLNNEANHWMNEALRKSQWVDDLLKEGYKQYADELSESLNQLITGLAKDGQAIEGFTKAWGVVGRYATFKANEAFDKLLQKDSLTLQYKEQKSE